MGHDPWRSKTTGPVPAATEGRARRGACAGARRAQHGRERAAARPLRAQATGRIRKTAVRGGLTWRAAKLGVRAGESRAQLSQKRAQLGQKRAQAGQKRAPAWPVSVQATGMVTGATLMYFLDPTNGRRRRHVARDRMLKQLRRSGREASRKARYAGGVAAGKAHEAASAGQPTPQPDDTTLAHTVDSEIFRSPDAPKGPATLNVDHGVVYPRG